MFSEINLEYRIRSSRNKHCDFCTLKQSKKNIRILRILNRISFFHEMLVLRSDKFGTKIQYIQYLHLHDCYIKKNNFYNYSISSMFSSFLHNSGCFPISVRQSSIKESSSWTAKRPNSSIIPSSNFTFFSYRSGQNSNKFV